MSPSDFETQRESTPDISWMLQSPQVSDVALVDALLEVEYGWLHQLARALGASQEEASQLVHQVLANAVFNRHTYWGEVSSRAWLAGQLIEKAHQPAQMTIKPRLAAILVHLMGFSEKEAVESLGWPERELREQLGQAYAEAAETWGLDDRKSLENRLAAELISAYPVAPLGAEAAALARAEVTEKLARRRSQSRFTLSLKNTLALGIVVALVAVVIWSVRLPVFVAPATPTPLPPVVNQVNGTLPALKPLPEALDANSSVRQVLGRMRRSSSLWRTIFADLFIYDYGPVNFVGPVSNIRLKVWLRRDQDAVILAGSMAAAPDYFRFEQGTRVYELDLAHNSGYDRNVMNTIKPRFNALAGAAGETVATEGERLTYSLTSMLYPQVPSQEVELMEVIGQDELSGRPAVVVQLRSPDGQLSQRLWVDSVYGIILAWQVWASDGSGRPVREGLLWGIKFDETFPSDFQQQVETLTDRGRLGWDTIWEPEHSQGGFTDSFRFYAWKSKPALQPAQPPHGWDPSRGTLTFQWGDPFEMGGLQDSPLSSEEETDVYSDEYLLGSLKVGDPRLLRCERSPDGSTMVLIWGADLPRFPAEDARWYRLDDMTPHLLLTEGSTVGSDVAFSPDGESLAFYGCGGSDSNCGVYLLKQKTGKSIKLLGMENSGDFVWSPDSRFLAFVGVETSSSLLVLEPKLFVVDTSTAMIVYDQGVSWMDVEVDPQSPIADWNVPFPPEFPGLEGCQTPIRAE